jgi:hypothetical protein
MWQLAMTTVRCVQYGPSDLPQRNIVSWRAVGIHSNSDVVPR